jgi:hypothetical protein
VGTVDESSDICEVKRQWHQIGIPILNTTTHKIEIKEYKFDRGIPGQSLSQADIVYDQILRVQGYKLYSEKLGVSSTSINDAISVLGETTENLEKILNENKNPQAFAALKQFNRLFGIYDKTTSTINIFDKLEEQEYAEAFYDAIKFIPLISPTLKVSEALFGFMYSETFNQSLLEYSKEELRILGNCETENCNSQRASMENIKKIAIDQLDDLQQQAEYSRHQQTCTCTKD